LSRGKTFRGDKVYLSKERSKGRLAYSARHAHKLCHCCITAGSNGSAVFAKSGGHGVPTTVFVLDLKLVLEELRASVSVDPCILQKCGSIDIIRTTKSRSPSS
jgi:hypothetical protein